MTEERRHVSAALVDCIAHNRAPSVRELDSMAARIWTESGPARSGFAWKRLEASCVDRVAALRLALAAANGSEA